MDGGDEGLDYIVDIGIAYDILNIVFSELYDESLGGAIYNIYGDILKKIANVPKAIPILKPENIKELDEVKDLNSENLIVILEPHAGNISFGPYQQIDNEGDEIGSICLTSGRGWLKNLISRICDKYRGVVVDLCDYFALDPRSLVVSCLCNSCLVELKKYIDEQLEQGFLRGTDIELSSDEVIDEVRKGFAAYAVAKISKEGWTPLIIPPRLSLRDILLLPKVEKYRSSFLKILKTGTDQEAYFEKALASFVLFTRARSRATAKNIIEVLSDLSCYKGVAIEHTGSLTLTLDVVEELLQNGVDVWVDKRIDGARYHNMPRSRYFLGQLNESLFNYMLRRILGAGDEDTEKGDRLLNKIRASWNTIVSALSKAWIPNPEDVKGTSLRYAVFGWPKEIVFGLMHRIIDTVRDHNLDLGELRTAREGFARLIRENDL